MEATPCDIGPGELCPICGIGIILPSNVCDHCNTKFGKVIANISISAKELIEECQTYHQPRIAELERLLSEAQIRIGDLCGIIGDLEQCRCVEGDSVEILCDNPEAESSETQAAVEACGDYTQYERQRFYGKTWSEALHKAANAARNHYSDQ